MDKTMSGTGRGGLTMVALALVLGAFAGCIGNATGKDAVDPAFKGDVRSTLASGNLTGGQGAVHGIVLNENGAPLAGAYVALLKTAFQATTNRSGTFKFNDVAPGVYTIRADLKPYESIESPVTVVVDKVTKTEVVLASDQGSVGLRDHVHNLWDDIEKERVLFDDDVSHPSSPICTAAVVTTQGAKNGQCWTLDILLEPGTTVPPGTKEVKMSVTWAKQEMVPSIEWRYTAANQSAFRIVKDLTSGTVVSVPVVSPMNDHGHATFTMWRFQMWAKPEIAGTVPISEEHFNEQFIGPYRVKIVAIKGDVFAEPPHMRYWANGPRILLTENEERKLIGPTSATRDPNSQCTYTGAVRAASLCYSFRDNKTVPPGATRLLVTMDYTWGQPAAAGLFHHKTLAFRPGNVNPAVATWDDFIFPPPTESPAGHLVWEVKLDPLETDAFYQSKSTWVLIIANQGEERAGSYTPDCPSACGGDIFKLTAEVVNDDWTEALAGGQS